MPEQPLVSAHPVVATCNGEAATVEAFPAVPSPKDERGVEMVRPRQIQIATFLAAVIDRQAPSGPGNAKAFAATLIPDGEGPGSGISILHTQAAARPAKIRPDDQSETGPSLGVEVSVATLVPTSPPMPLEQLVARPPIPALPCQPCEPPFRGEASPASQKPKESAYPATDQVVGTGKVTKFANSRNDSALKGARAPDTADIPTVSLGAEPASGVTVRRDEAQLTDRFPDIFGITKPSGRHKDSTPVATGQRLSELDATAIATPDRSRRQIPVTIHQDQQIRTTFTGLQTQSPEQPKASRPATQSSLEVASANDSAPATAMAVPPAPTITSGSPLPNLSPAQGTGQLPVVGVPSVSTPSQVPPPMPQHPAGFIVVDVSQNRLAEPTVQDPRTALSAPPKPSKGTTPTAVPPNPPNAGHRQQSQRSVMAVSRQNLSAILAPTVTVAAVSTEPQSARPASVATGPSGLSGSVLSSVADQAVEPLLSSARETDTTPPIRLSFQNRNAAPAPLSRRDATTHFGIVANVIRKGSPPTETQVDPGPTAFPRVTPSATMDLPAIPPTARAMPSGAFSPRLSPNIPAEPHRKTGGPAQLPLPEHLPLISVHPADRAVTLKATSAPSPIAPTAKDGPVHAVQQAQTPPEPYAWRPSSDRPSIARASAAPGGQPLSEATVSNRQVCEFAGVTTQLTSDDMRSPIERHPARLMIPSANAQVALSSRPAPSNSAPRDALPQAVRVGSAETPRRARVPLLPAATPAIPDPPTDKGGGPAIDPLSTALGPDLRPCFTSDEPMPEAKPKTFLSPFAPFGGSKQYRAPATDAPPVRAAEEEVRFVANPSTPAQSPQLPAVSFVPPEVKTQSAGRHSSAAFALKREDAAPGASVDSSGDRKTTSPTGPLPAFISSSDPSFSSENCPQPGANRTARAATFDHERSRLATGTRPPTENNVDPEPTPGSFLPRRDDGVSHLPRTPAQSHIAEVPNPGATPRQVTVSVQDTPLTVRVPSGLDAGGPILMSPAQLSIDPPEPAGFGTRRPVQPIPAPTTTSETIHDEPATSVASPEPRDALREHPGTLPLQRHLSAPAGAFRPPTAPEAVPAVSATASKFGQSSPGPILPVTGAPVATKEPPMSMRRADSPDLSLAQPLWSDQSDHAAASVRHPTVPPSLTVRTSVQAVFSASDTESPVDHVVGSRPDEPPAEDWPNPATAGPHPLGFGQSFPSYSASRPEMPSTAPVPLHQPILPPAAIAVHPAHWLPKGLPAFIAKAAVRAGSEDRLELMLDPIELGRVRFALATGPDQLQVTLHVERPETLDLLRRHANELRQELRDAGFGGASLSFSSSGREQKPDQIEMKPIGPPDSSETPDNLAPSQGHDRVSQANLDLRV